jgi:hypothetical protein
MKKILLFFIMLMSVMLVSCESGWEDVEPDSKTLDGFYEDPMGSFSIRYNTNWEVSRNKILMFTNQMDAEYPERVTISVLDMQTKPIPLFEYAEHIKEGIKQISSDFVLLDSINSTHDGDPAYSMIFSYKYNDLDFQERKFLKQKNNRIYILSYTALEKNFNEHSDLIQDMIDTLICY